MGKMKGKGFLWKGEGGGGGVHIPKFFFVEVLFFLEYSWDSGKVFLNGF